MSALRNAARRFFGKSIEIIDLEIKLHKEANLYGRHGTLIASHVEQKLQNYPVRFVFKGLSSPPALTPRILDFIWEEAKAQGYVPHRLENYGEVLLTSAVAPRELVSDDAKAAINQFHDTASDELPNKTKEIASAAMMADLVAVSEITKSTGPGAGAGVGFSNVRNTVRMELPSTILHKNQQETHNA